MKGAVIVLLATVGWSLYYGLACLIWPSKACRRCEGVGRFHARWGGRGWRHCPRCKGTGERFRFGRRIWNLWRRLRSS